MRGRVRSVSSHTREPHRCHAPLAVTQSQSPSGSTSSVQNGPSEHAIRPLAIGRRKWPQIAGNGGLKSASELLSVTASMPEHRGVRTRCRLPIDPTTVTRRHLDFGRCGAVPHRLHPATCCLPRRCVGVSDRSSLRRLVCAIRSITPTHATLSATGYILLQPEPAKATAWSLPEHLHGHPGQGLATGRVDLAGHDQGARLVLRDSQFCKARVQVGWSS